MVTLPGRRPTHINCNYSPLSTAYYGANIPAWQQMLLQTIHWSQWGGSNHVSPLQGGGGIGGGRSRDRGPLCNRLWGELQDKSLVKGTCMVYYYTPVLERTTNTESV